MCFFLYESNNGLFDEFREPVKRNFPLDSAEVFSVELDFVVAVFFVEFRKRGLLQRL